MVFFCLSSKPLTKIQKNVEKNQKPAQFPTNYQPKKLWDKMKSRWDKIVWDKMKTTPSKKACLFSPVDKTKNPLGQNTLGQFAIYPGTKYNYYMRNSNNEILILLDKTAATCGFSLAHASCLRLFIL